MLDFEIVEKIAQNGKSEEAEFKQEVLRDFWVCCVSREVSLLGRREVLTGKAKFGILGDGKEVPQVAMARAFRKGDWRSGYYRDQTFIFALGLCTVEEYFAQLYADAENDPFSGGRQMNAHFATPTIDPEGNWLEHTSRYNISSDISPTGGQMARALGLAFASKMYRNNPALKATEHLSDDGNEVCFCTIGDASTSEGIFWETVNAATVLQVPLAIMVWDDGYGISVPKSLQTAKHSISKVLKGFTLEDDDEGLLIYTAKAWDYPTLCEIYERGIRMVRNHHIPAIFHIEECTQPQGHSTSGSHERYKNKERLQWEEDVDCIKVMGEWMVENGIAAEDEIQEIREKAKTYARDCKTRAWKQYMDPVRELKKDLNAILDELASEHPGIEAIEQCKDAINAFGDVLLYELLEQTRRVAHAMPDANSESMSRLRAFIRKLQQRGKKRYHSNLYSTTEKSALQVPVIPAMYEDEAEEMNGFQVLNAFFDKVLEKKQGFFAFGEDLGKIGGVNQGFAGLQEKYGKRRVFDTGIREWTIIGQAIGSAMRGLRPLAEIQYLDYLIYGLTPLTDDLATLRYRSNGIQKAPAIIRTRGHRLEGIWHTGSPMGMLIHSLRGIFVCVPRNMVQATGMYNTLLQSDDPGLVIECLNGYRLKEKLPSNIGEYTIPLGVPEILQEGEDITLVTYGSCVRIAQDAVEQLMQLEISVELIDVQTLLPFDLEQTIVHSLKKTNRVVFMDEDVPGGASAYMMREVLETQEGYRYLDSMPVCITAHEHRTPYGSDGDYFAKPNAGDVVDVIYQIMHEFSPQDFPISE